MARTTKQKATDLYASKIDIVEDARKELVAMLNQQLADTFDLYSQTKQAHWNVKGEDFYSLHKFFDDLAESVEDYVDTIAERITALGGVAMGTVRMAAANSTLKEYTPDIVSGMESVKALIERYAAYAAANRVAIERARELGDPSTEDLLIEISRVIDKDLYFLESHVQG
jgi:starvation-inducible DNA-binding protein